MPAVSISQGSPNVQLLAHLNQYSSVGYNDCWGYTAPDGREYALLGVQNGTSIIDITDAPTVTEVTFVPSSSSLWKDIKTYRNYAYVVNESGGGMQIIDLSNLPISATLVNTYTGFSTSHNIYVDTANAILYAEGSTSQPVRALSLGDPVNPVQLSFFGIECHDIYARNNIAYISEGNSGSIGVYNLSTPTTPVLLRRFPIPNAGYVHNAWLSDDGNYLMTTEETTNKTTKLWDIRNLNNVFITDEYLAAPGLLAHNAHLKGKRAYLSYYTDGLRIVNIANPDSIFEEGYYDTYPGTPGGFNGAWGAFPYFASGKVLISDIQTGLYVVFFAGSVEADSSDPKAPTNFTAYSDVTTPTSIALRWTNPTTLVDGTPITAGDFQILIRRDSILITTVPGSDSTYTDIGLSTYTQFGYAIQAKLIANDSTSSSVETSWHAGGSPFPGAPLLDSLATNATTARLRWTEPLTQADGTPIHDYIGSVVFRNGIAVDSVGAGVSLYIDTPPAGFVYSYTVKARNNLNPRRYSLPSNSKSGYVGSIPNILVWQPADVVSQSRDSIASSLTRLAEGHFTTDSLFKFGTNLGQYEAIFVLLGIYSNNHVLGASDPEGAALEGYISAGGHVYLEGGDCFNYDPESAGGYQIRPWFGLNDGADGGSDISDVTGQTIMEGLGFSYGGVNNFMDELHPNSGGGGRVLFTAPTSTPANDTVAVFNFFGAGRTVGSVYEFGGLVDNGTSRKDSVLSRTLRFFRQSLSLPHVAVSPLSLIDTLQTGQSRTQILSVRNTTLPPSNPLYVSLSESAPWLSIFPTLDTLNGGQTGSINVSFNAAGLAPGTYTNMVVVSSNDISNPTLDIPVTLQVTGSPIIAIRPDSVTMVLGVDSTAVDTITIRNIGIAPLMWTITDVPASLQQSNPGQPQADELYPPRLGRDGWPVAQGKNDQDIHHGPNQVNGFGGPDSAGYRWIDSDEPGGPTFNWVDITSIGTAIPVGAWRSSGGGANADDGYVRLKLPWPFTFYGVTYTDSLKVVTNGWQSLDQTSTNTAFSNVAIPATAQPNTIIGPWWDDLDLRTAGTVHYYNDVANNRFIVQYTNVPHFSSGELYTFQTILYANGTILYQYLDMQSLLTSATIGIENQGGTVGLQVVFNAAYMHNNLSISIANDVSWLSETPTSGTVAPGDSVKVEVIFNSGGLSSGIYTGSLEISSNDPALPTVSIPVHMMVNTVTSSAEPPDVDLPRQYFLGQNYPNPFNPTTTIRFGLPEQSSVSIKIYSMLGQDIRTLVNESRDAGYHEALWDGRNDLGVPVTTGIYFYRMEARSLVSNSVSLQGKKTVLLK